MKAACIILALATIAALAFGLTATSGLGALEAQVADLTAQLDQARTDLALSEEINQAYEKEQARLKAAADQPQSQPPPMDPAVQPPQGGTDGLSGAPAA